jgi:hypothetical protein
MRIGVWLIVLGALLGLAVSIYNYVSPVSFLAPDSGIAGTGGAALVVFSTAVLLIFGLMLLGRRWGRGMRAFVLFGALVDIVGTAFAAYLLNSKVLLLLMVLCFIGWLMRMMKRTPATAPSFR